MENKKSKKIIIGVICAVVAVALVVAGLAIAGVFSKEPNEDPSNSTTESTTKAPKYDPTKYEVQGIDDKSYLVVLGEDGKAIINDKNQINVVDRDKKGEIIKDENGEPQTHWEQIDDKYVVKDKIYATDYEINVIEGWEAFGSGYIIKTGLGTNCVMKLMQLGGDAHKSLSLDQFLETVVNPSLLKDKATREEKGQKVTYEEKETTITDKDIRAISTKQVIYNADGKLINYKEIIYFELDGNQKYKFEYVCAGEEIYNLVKDFDFVDFVDKNLKFN